MLDKLGEVGEERSEGARREGTEGMMGEASEGEGVAMSARAHAICSPTARPPIQLRRRHVTRRSIATTPIPFVAPNAQLDPRRVLTTTDPQPTNEGPLP